MDRTLLYRCLLLLPSMAFALPQTTSSTSSATQSTTSQPAFPTMSAQDGVGVPDGGVGSTANPTAPGANGADQGAFSISTGAIVGISVAIGLVVLAIAALWFLWYMAKKRQWNVRESIRRASRRFTGRKNPPKAMSSGKNKRGTVYIKPGAIPGKPSAARTRDVERGLSRIDEAGKLPTHGWLADEKERSRSRSREDEERIRREGAQSGTAVGWKSKLPFGGR